MGRLALFDMDKTLVRKNTARLYTQHQRRQKDPNAIGILQLNWWLFLYSIGKLKAEEVALEVLSQYKGQREIDARQDVAQWFPEYVLPHITPTAREAVERHRAQGDHLVIATTATRYGAELLMRELDMDELLCTELEQKDGRFTGRVSSGLCYGEGKLALARSYAKSQGFELEKATFYTDSVTDLPLLEAVGEPVAVNPDLSLLRQAKRKGFRIEKWS